MRIIIVCALVAGCGDVTTPPVKTDGGIDAGGDATRTDWLEGWSHRRPLTIGNGTGVMLSDQQLFFDLDTHSLIVEGKMASTCGDLRVTNGDGKTLLPYWIESGAGTPATRVWVKVPTVPLAGNLYVYYGNAAGSAESAKDVFAFFDDFNGTTLDTMWTTQTLANGLVSVAGGELRLSAAAGGTNGNQAGVLGPRFDRSVFVGARLTQTDPLGAGTHADVVLQSASVGFYFQNGHWAVTSYGAQSGGTGIQVASVSGGVGPATSLPAMGAPSHVLYLQKDLDNTTTGVFKGETNHVAIGTLNPQTGATWNAGEARYLVLSANSYVSPVPAFDFRFDWVFVANFVRPFPTLAPQAEEVP